MRLGRIRDHLAPADASQAPTKAALEQAQGRLAQTTAQVASAHEGLEALESEVGKSALSTVRRDVAAGVQCRKILFLMEHPSPSQLRVMRAMQEFRQALGTTATADGRFAVAELEKEETYRQRCVSKNGRS